MLGAAALLTDRPPSESPPSDQPCALGGSFGRDTHLGVHVLLCPFLALWP